MRRRIRSQFSQSVMAASRDGRFSWTRLLLGGDKSNRRGAMQALGLQAGVPAQPMRGGGPEHQGQRHRAKEGEEGESQHAALQQAVRSRATDTADAAFRKHNALVIAVVSSMAVSHRKVEPR